MFLVDLIVPDDLPVLGLVVLMFEDLEELLIVPFLEVRIAEFDLLALEPVALRDNLLVE